MLFRSSKIEKLLVLKSTGSAFHGFHRDEFTRLPETWDRILSTDVEAGWQWKMFKTVDEVGKVDFDGAWKTARDITLKVFAEDNSASVQATMYTMCDDILAALPSVEAVDYSLPNKHYFEVGECRISFCSVASANALQTSAGTKGSRIPERMRRCLHPSRTPTALSNARSSGKGPMPSCRARSSALFYCYHFSLGCGIIYAALYIGGSIFCLGFSSGAIFTGITSYQGADIDFMLDNSSACMGIGDSKGVLTVNNLLRYPTIDLTSTAVGKP